MISPATSNKVTLIGAGLAGPLLSIYLARRGFQVEIYERRPDPRRARIGAGRSINLALSARGIYALKEVGLAEDVLRDAVPMKGRLIHLVEGGQDFQAYSNNAEEVIYSISRIRLNQVLMDAAESTGRVSIHFGQRCTGLDLETGALQLAAESARTTHQVVRAPVIATDGSASAVRRTLGRLPGHTASEESLPYGYKELTIPPGAAGGYQLEPHALHIWPRGASMLIALPNFDHSFTCTLFLPLQGAVSFAALDSPEKVARFFQDGFPDAALLIPQLEADFLANPTGSLATVRCDPWYVGGQLLLLGDAAHAMVPFFGQGMNCAFEDCTHLNACIAQQGPDWEPIFAAFERSRKADTDAIAQMALDNFTEMSALVSDPAFVLRRRVELALEARFPDEFVSRYALVTFRRVPYAEAQHRGAAQAVILDVLCAGLKGVEELDWTLAAELLERRLAQH